MKHQSTLHKIAWALCLLTGIVLSLKAIREPDLWWMYRTGEWMLEQGQVTRQDPFSYTFEGVEWINVKWLFEILISLAKSAFGVEFIFVFQALVTLVILSLFYRSAQLIYAANPSQKSVQTPFTGLFFAALLMLYTIDFRLIGRPEMTSHLMVAVYLYLFWKYYYRPSKWIYALIPLQILWTNMHEAYGTGMILMSVYWLASCIQFRFWPVDSLKKDKLVELSKAVGIALIAVALNPRGIQMYWHPFEIYAQLGDNQFTTELAPIWKRSYWEPQAYFNMLFFALSLVLIALTPFIGRTKVKEQKNTKAKKRTQKTGAVSKAKRLNWWQHNIHRFGLANGTICLMLFYLSLTAFRNIPFFIIATAPLVAISIQLIINKFIKVRTAYGLAILCALLFYGAVISGKYHEWSKSRDQYGLQVLASHNPVGAANFIKEHQIQGTCFADYLTSSYLLWNLQPDFKTYIDLRDLDIFSKDFFTDFAQITAVPSLFDEKVDSFDFNYVVLFRPQFQTLQKHLLDSDAFDLVFVDPVACIYLRQNQTNATLIDQFGFKKNNYKDIFSSLQKVEASAITYYISKLFNPFYQPTDYSKTDENAIAGSYYLNLKLHQLAFDRANQSIQSNIEPWNGYELMGNLYNNLAFTPPLEDSLKTVYISQAKYYYNQSLGVKPDHINALIGKATIAMQQQDFNTAIFLYHQVLEIDPNFALAIQYLGLCHKILSNQKGQASSDTRLWLSYMQRLDKLNPDNPYIRLDIGIAHCILGDCEQSLDYLKGLIDVPGLPAEELKSAKSCLKRCGGL